jgi:hypothetical protein
VLLAVTTPQPKESKRQAMVKRRLPNVCINCKGMPTENIKAKEQGADNNIIPKQNQKQNQNQKPRVTEPRKRKPKNYSFPVSHAYNAFRLTSQRTTLLVTVQAYNAILT